MNTKKLFNDDKNLSKKSIDTHQTEKDKAVNSRNNKEQLENLVVSTGIGFSKLKSLAKCIDTVIDDEMYFKPNDFENLIIILKNVINETSEQFEKIEKYLGI